MDNAAGAYHVSPSMFCDLENMVLSIRYALFSEAG